MTLFGISEKKKRGIVVPVMALAVCAVAMVGLGFAIQTSVTSNVNNLQSLMIDLDDTYNGFSADGPDASKVDELFKLEVFTNNGVYSGTVSDVASPVKTVSGGKAYMKIFGNISDVTLKVKANNGLSGATKVNLSVYAIGENGVRSGSAIATVELSDDNEKLFNMVDSNKINCDTVYWVEISSIVNGDKTVLIDPSAETCSDASHIPDNMVLSLTFTAKSA